MQITKPTKAEVTRELKDYIFITLGLISYALGWAAFLIPYQITTGGTTGIGAIIYYATGFPIQWSYFIINAVLMTFAIKILGPKFSIKTTLAIIHKYKDVTLGRMIMACDFIIISSCYVVFHDWRRVIFGFVTLFVIGFVLDYIVNSARQSVQFFIFSKEYEKIADRITKETHRGVTVLDGIGWYSKHNVKVLVVLAYKRQSVEIFRMVKDIDPNAFISQSSVIGVYGEGFDRLKVK